VWFSFAFPLWLEMMSIFSCIFCPFEFLLLRKFCFVQLPISLLVHHGEHCGAEQWLYRPMGHGLGRPALLLLDHGVEKPSTI
jgi:hypothetical protein